MTLNANISPFHVWIAERAFYDPDTYHYDGSRVIDRFGLTDGRTMWGAYYGEGPRESFFKGTVGKLLVGCVHLDDGVVFESFLPTIDGKVLHVITNQSSGAIEGPVVLDEQSQISHIQKIESLIA